MFLMLLWLAGASPVTEEVVQTVLELTDVVESLSGRELGVPPRVVLTDVHTFSVKYRDAMTAVLVDLGLPEAEASRLAKGRSKLDLRGTLALYWTLDERIYLLVDRIESWSGGRLSVEMGGSNTFMGGKIASAKARLQAADSHQRAMEMVECSLAHELVHAIQDQHHPIEALTDQDAWLAFRALEEGQAVVLGDRACRVRGHFATADRMLASHSTRSGADDELSLLYGYGPEVVRELMRQGGGQEPVWRTFEDPPATPEAFLELAYHSAVARTEWLEGDALPAVVRALTEEDAAVSTGPTDVRHVFWIQDGPVEPAAHTILRLQARAQRKRGSLEVVLWTFDEDGWAQRVLESQRDAVRAFKVAMRQSELARVTDPFTRISLYLHRTRFRAARKHIDGSDGFKYRMIITPRHRDWPPVQEYWLATGRELVVVSATHSPLPGREVGWVVAELLAGAQGPGG